MIPKIIHYCWLSNDPVPVDYQRCMATWKEKLPDYDLMLWDTKRFDINSVLWVKQAFEAELYAFAADYIRLCAVYNYGGIYLDMDMEVIKPFDELLNSELLIAYENLISETEKVEAGCFGAAVNHPYIKKCMEYYEKVPFFDETLRPRIMGMKKLVRINFIKPLFAPEIMGNAAKDFSTDKQLKIYTRDYFTAKDPITGEIKKTSNTFTIHHFTTQYRSERWRKIRNTKQLIWNIFGKETAVSKIIIRIYGAMLRVRAQGFFVSIKYYIDRFILRKIPAEVINLEDYDCENFD
ncbi:MAG: glycosyl transferase [Treponema sp.]|nr:glycosyl transferase [Treponema sp.]